jgi:hypothetical protein
LGSDEHAPGRGRGLGEAGKDFDPQPAAGQGTDPIETSLVEINGGTTAIDTNRFLGEGILGDLENDRSIGEKDHGTVGLGVSTVGDGIDTQGRVLVEPHQIGVGKNDLHPRLTGGIHAVSTHQGHINDRFQAFLLVGGLHGRIALEVRDVAQRGHLVLARGHRYAAQC